MDALIRNTGELEAACAAARAGGVLALDTEFVWKRTYRPQLCLVQCADASGDGRAVDCLLGTSTAPLAAALEDASVVKVLHDARQDLCHIRHLTGASPRNVFDTQLAAGFAGFSCRLGLQKLLFEAIGVGLPKTETLTDWSRRPLSPAQLEYALDDVRYLPRLRDELLRRADAAGTRAWLEEDLAALDDPALYADPDPDEMWKRVKTGRMQLDGRAFAALRAVAAVRERKAREWNLPRQWLTEDLSLVDVAVHAGARPRFRHRLRGYAMRDALADEYAAALASAAALPESEWPEDPRPHYIREVHEAADEAMKWLAVRAAEVGVDPESVAARATLTAFVDATYDESNPLARGWRFEVAGREIAERFGVE